jgi:hypothetical protein
MPGSGNGCCSGKDGKREKAYKVGGKVTRDRMAREVPLDAEALGRVEVSDIVVVRGQYDRVEQVLDAIEVPYTLISPLDLERVRLFPNQVLVINCPGQVDESAIPGIRSFVERGGTLFTTDWALRHILEKAFPGVLAFNRRETRDDVVRIEVKNKDNRFLAGVMDEGDDPQWWLEGSSYPISILAPEKVEVLITSRELERKYGEAPVAVRFRHGEGEVFHMISHYYLQRTELRDGRHMASASEYVAAKGVVLDPSTAMEMRDLKVGDVESAASSTRLFANVIAAKKRGPGPSGNGKRS